MRKRLKIITNVFRRIRTYKKEPGANGSASDINSDRAAGLLQASAFGNLRMYREAIKSYKKVVQIDPRNAEAYFHLGSAYCMEGMFLKAIEALKQSTRLNPNDARAYYYLGNAYSKSGKFHAAISATKRTLQINPNIPGGHKRLGILYSSIGMYDKAVEALRQAVESEPGSSSARYYLAVVHLALQDRNAALKEYEILKGISPRTARKLSKEIYD